MPGFSTLSTCPFNSNTIFVCKNYTQMQFLLMLGDEITDNTKKSESLMFIGPCIILIVE